MFKVKTNGTSYAVLRDFKTNNIDGQNASPGLELGADGILYGATIAGGSNNVGTVYKLNTDGNGYAILRHFRNSGNDGQQPYAGVVQAGDGALYGITRNGGSENAGTVFKLNTNGTGYAVLHHFSTNDNDGQNPSAPLIQASDGALYGTTRYGGNAGYDLSRNGYGTVFKVGGDGSGYSVIHSFTGPDGAYPLAALLQGGDGALYGTTSGGGTNNLGTVFRLSVSSGKFASFALLPDKTFQFSINGGTFDYRIDASTNLVNWVALTNIANTIGAVQFIDTNAVNFPRRFYRTQWVP